MKERECAYNCLVKILIDKQFSNIVLKNTEDVTPLVTQLVYGTLRNYRLVREAWSKHSNKIPVTKIAVLLDMACYELLLLDKPEYATVSEAVEIAKRIKGGNYKGYVNAILRKVTKEDLNLKDLAIATSHPDWIVNLWKAHYGVEMAEKICRADILDGRVSLRVNPMKTTQQKLLEDSKFSKGSIDGCLYYDGNIVDTDYFKNGAVVIQSESSQLAANALEVKENMRVLDLCAAPGSKTVQIAQQMNNTGTVVSNDVYDFRVALIQKNAEKYGLTNIETSCHDGCQIHQFYPEKSFDAVLLDAPCSGLGTLRHKPEIKITTTAGDLDNIVALQKQLLEEADRMVKDNGVLVYSTCTLNKKENERQIEAFVKIHSNYIVESQTTVFPSDYDSDGFFICRLLKQN